MASQVNAVFVGAGAVGCFYASRLHHPIHGINVSLVARSNYAALQEHGIKMVTHTFGNYHFSPAAAYPSASSAATAAKKNNFQWDFVFVATKALPDINDDSATIVPLVGPNTVIVLIQNGVGIETPYRLRFPDTAIISAVTVISTEQTLPGIIRQNRWTRISIGPYTNGRGSGSPILTKKGIEAVGKLVKWWRDFGGIKDVEPHDEVDLQIIRWHKLCINAAMNPSAVLSGGRGNADMASDPELREHLRGVMEEVRMAVPKILGKEFPEDLAQPDAILKSTDRNKGVRPSMLLDWEAGRPMEIEVILGNPVRIAREAGAMLPRIQTLYALLRSVQSVRQKNEKKPNL